MTANINPVTGIAYGYISANALDPEVVNDLQMNGTDVYFEEAKAEAQRETAQDDNVRREAAEHMGYPITGLDAIAYEDILRYVEDNWAGSRWEQTFSDNYQPDEPVHEGEVDVPGHGKVKYRTSWLGGALNVWVFESPFVTEKANLCSPCVPGAGNLDVLDGGFTCYNVPNDWRRWPNEGEVAEWVGQHYAKHYPSLDEAGREDMRHRYMVAHWLIDPDQIVTEKAEPRDRSIPGNGQIRIGDWIVESNGEYLYVHHVKQPGDIHVKAEAEGFVIDVYDDDVEEAHATLSVEYVELKGELL